MYTSPRSMLPCGYMCWNADQEIPLPRSAFRSWCWRRHPILGSHFRKAQIDLARISDVQLGAVDGAGAVVVMSSRQFLHSSDGTAVSPVHLSVLRIEHGRTGRERPSVFTGDSIRLEALFFEANELVLAGASDRRMLVVARCTLGSKEVSRCRWRDLAIDAGLFELAGFDSRGSVVVASRVHRVGGNGLRACLFAFADHLPSLPDACRLTTPVTRVLGSIPEAFYSMAPDRRHVAVLTSRRSARGDAGPASASPIWAVVPTSVFRVD